MKRKLTRIWGIGLTLMLLVSLLVVAAPASAADPLQWNQEVLPSPGGVFLLAGGGNILDFAIGSDGTTIYAVGTQGSDTTKVWKSTNAGASWTDLATGTLGTAAITNTQLVAIAPDDVNTLVVVDASTSNVTALVSTNGGATFSTLGEVADSTGGSSNDAYIVYDVAISSTVSPGIRYVALPGNTAATDTGSLFYFDLGAASPDWRDAVDDSSWTALSLGGIDAFRAVAFSPNFAADYTAVVLSELSGLNGNIQLHALSFNVKNWNSFTSYPVTVTQRSAAGSTFTVTAADVALAPDYVGSDDVSRIAFVAAAVTDNGTAGAGGLFRNNDNQTTKVLKSATDLNSVDFNGTNLVAGSYSTNIVWRSADPLATTPTVLPSRSNKRIGVTGTSDAVLVAWNGDDVLGAKSGDASAFSKSQDNGMTWNDISLIDSALTTIEDIYVTPDASVLYVVAQDSSETSLYRNAGSWQRVLTLGNTNGYFLRGAPDDNDVLYVVDSSGTAIYYTADGGVNRWYVRAASASITDLAVESADVSYIGTGGTVRKSTNGGFTWSSPKTPELDGGSVATIVSLGEDKLIVGGNAGKVSYSTDGNASWATIVKDIDNATINGNIQVTASGLEAGDYIYAASSTNGTGVWRFTVGDPPPTSWKNLATSSAWTVATSSALGIGYMGGALYVLGTDGNDTEVIRSLNPGAPAAWEWSNLNNTGEIGTLTPSALKVSAGSNKLWFVDTGATDAVESYIDTLADTAPEVTGPADGTINPMNPVSGRSVDVSFSWNRPSVNANRYDIEVYTDATGFHRILQTSVAAPAPWAVVVLGPYQTATGQTLEWVSGQTYYWRVRVSPRGYSSGPFTGPIYSAWSEMRSLTIEAGAASVPSVASPANGAEISSTSPAFSWNPVVGATKYEFQLAVSTNFGKPLFKAELDTTGIRPVVKLNDGMTYFWRVRSIAPVVGSWSTIANFTVAVPVAAEPPAPPQVTVQPSPAPVVNIPPIEIPAPVVNIPPAPQPVAPINQSLLWAVIIIGAILVIALIVLIVRTRRTV